MAPCIDRSGQPRALNSAATIPVLLTAAAFAVLNLALKAPTVGVDGLWLDEAVSLFVSQQAPAEIVRWMTADHNPPAYNLVLHVWMSVWGMSETSARALSVLCHALTAALLYLVMARHFSRRAATVSALLFTLSTINHSYAREARCYALVGLLCVLSFAEYLSILRAPTALKAVGLTLVNASLLYTHYLTIYILVVQALSLPVLRSTASPAAGRYVIASLVGSAALFAPWLPYLAAKLPSERGFWLGRPSTSRLAGVLKRFANRQPLVMYGVLALHFRPVREAFRLPSVARREDALHTLLLLWAFVPVVLGFLAAQVWPIFHHRYVLYASIGLFAAVGALASLPRRSATLAAVLVLLAAAKYQPITLKPTDWQNAVSFVRAHADERTTIVLLPSAEVLPFSYYFDRSAFEQYRTLATSMRNRRVFPIDDLNQLTSAAVAGTSRVLVVRRLDAKYDIDAVANATRPGGDVVARQRVRGIELAVYDHPERE